MLYFRRRVPDDLRSRIGKPYLTKSLGTGTRRDAIILARAFAAKTDSLFHNIRAMQDDDQTPGTIRINYEFGFDLKSLLITVKDAKPEDQQAIDSHIATVLQNLPANGQSPTAPAVSDENITGGKTILDVWELYRAAQVARGKQKDVKEGWADEKRAAIDYLPHVRDFIDHVGGDKPIAAVTRGDVISFRNHVTVIDGLGSASNRRKKLRRACGLFKYAVEQEFIADNFDSQFRFKGTVKKNPHSKFTQSDLAALFQSGTYRNQEHTTTSQYWLPLLGLHTGARLNELCQLLKSDVQAIDGVDIISILDGEESKRLKTDAARRLVPIHSKLIELGFLDFVKACPDGRIFPHLREDPLKPGDFGQKATEDFTAYRRSVAVGKMEGEGKSNKTFHSFRSTFIDAMRQAGVDLERRKRLVGHDYDDTHNTNYSGGDLLDMFPIAMLKKDVETVQFSIDFTPRRQIP